MSVLSLVTVREGSEGLKNKCLKKIGKKAVFEYTIEYSLELERRLRGEVFTYVSSDSGAIEKYCAERNVSFLKRSRELASAVARIEDVIYDAYQEIGKSFDYISLLYGNIPTRYPEEFLAALTFLEINRDYDAALSMNNVEKYNPAWMFELNENVLADNRKAAYRRQDLKQLMIHDGHTIIFKTGYFLDFMKSERIPETLYQFFGKKIKPMLNDRVIIDIDTEKDLKLAEAFILREMNESGQRDR